MLWTEIADTGTTRKTVKHEILRVANGEQSTVKDVITAVVDLWVQKVRHDIVFVNECEEKTHYHSTARPNELRISLGVEFSLNHSDETHPNFAYHVQVLAPLKTRDEISDNKSAHQNRNPNLKIKWLQQSRGVFTAPTNERGTFHCICLGDRIPLESIEMNIFESFLRGFECSREDRSVAPQDDA